MANAKTRLAEAYSATSQTGTKITDIGFSYSLRGQISDVYQFTPHSSGYYHVNALYWESGAPRQLGSLMGLPTITYAPDGEGRPNAVNANLGQNPVTSTIYNLYSTPPQLKVTFGSADSDVFILDPNTSRMNKYQFNVGSQTVTGTLTWNANGSLSNLNIADPFNPLNSQSCSSTADDLARISKVDCGTAWGQTFSYDPFGNLTKTKISGSGGTSFVPTYQSSPSITNRVSQVGGVTATYDANGNSLNDTFRTYAWDAENRPVIIGTINLTYDALGRMVEETVGSTNSEIVYSPTGVKLALMNSTTLIKAFVPLTGGATAVYNSSGLAYYRHADHLGSSRFASTPTQTLYSDTAYSPFGEVYASLGAIDPSFTGQNQDTTTALYDFLNRENDPFQSRWASPDPSGLSSVNISDPQSLNRYVYVRNSPLTLVDPLGLSPTNTSNVSPSFRVNAGYAGRRDDGPTCILDGVETSCSVVTSGGSAACPNNTCRGIGAAGRPVYFWASANGPGSYYAYSGPSALYYSVQAAGIAAINYIYDTHGNAPREYGNDIYQDQNGVYSFNEPVPGPDCTINTLCSVSPRDFSEPDDTEIVGLFHTHPFGGDFSSADISAADKVQVPSFLGNPQGCIVVYYPADPSNPNGPPRGGILQGTPNVCP